MVYGKLMPAADSLATPALPIGLAHHIVLQRPVAAGQAVRWSDVTIDSSVQAIQVRREMEALFRKEMGLAAPRNSIAA
jgi:predicted homoserine dehydrogenase-like protein